MYGNACNAFSGTQDEFEEAMSYIEMILAQKPLAQNMFTNTQVICLECRISTVILHRSNLRKRFCDQNFTVEFLYILRLGYLLSDV